MRLTEAQIHATRLAALQKANPGPTLATPVVQGALVSGQAVTTTVPIVIPKPLKKIFTIVSWNIQDYKGSKITDNKSWVHDFIKLLVESLTVDLLLLIETDVDLTEAAARIELADHQNWGSELPTSPCAFHLAASGRTFKKVELPASFTLAHLQNDKLTPSEELDWREEIEGFFYTYAATYQGKPIDYPALRSMILGGKPWSPGQVVFTRGTRCPACAGAGCVCAGKKTCAWCTCKACGGQHDAYPVCPTCKCSTCQELGIVTRPCSFCGSTGAPCITCGGAKDGLQDWCPACHCRRCAGEGTLATSQQQTCSGCGGGGKQTVTCPKCQGARGTSQACSNCHGGSHPFASQCQPCGGRGQVTVPCDGCGGAGQGPVVCAICSGAGTEVVSITTDCPTCGATGRLPRLPDGQPCPTCEDTGTYHVRCSACAPARCHACGGAGDPSEDAWTQAIELASTLLKTEVFGAYDVETYTLMWRSPQARLPSQFGLGHEACDRKLAWLCPGATLCSTDKHGAELGYQDLGGEFNCRSPFTLPLWLSLGGKHVQVPMAALHAIWGTSAAKYVTARGVSVEKMLSLAIAYPGADLEALGDYADPLLVGDFNLNYKPGSTGGHSKAFYSLAGKGYRTTTSGTQTSLSMLGAGIKKLMASSDTAKLYSAAYDHFLLKTGSALDGHVVQAGVIDILDMAKRLIVANPTLAAQIDADAAATTKTKKGVSKPKKPSQIFDLTKTKDPDLARAFYLYRKYVSDHIPILIDILVDTQDVKQAELRDWMLKQGEALHFYLGQQPARPSVPSYRGHWVDGKFELYGAHALTVEPGGKLVKLCGQVVRWRRDSVTVRVSEIAKDGTPTGVHIEFIGTHNIDPEILRDFKTVGASWLRATFQVSQAPDAILPQAKGQTPEPPAFWRPK